MYDTSTNNTSTNDEKNDDASVLVMAASTRTGSINRALAHQIADEIRRVRAEVDVIELRDHPLPLYDADLELSDGIPAAAYDLARRLADADVLVIVSPEYNGAFTPLLKNTVDWVTRVDVAAFAHLTVLLASASPGQGGGANGVEMVRTWMSNMGIDVADHTLSVGSAELADDRSVGGGLVDGVDGDELNRFVHQVAWHRVAA